MKNVLQYYYNLTPQSIHQKNSNYKCVINKQEYIFCNVDISENELAEIYQLSNYLISYGIFCHQIILNTNKRIITYVEGRAYVLLRTFIYNKEFTDKDLFLFSKIYIDKGKYRLLDRSNWYALWTAKVDYIEYQAGQFGKNFPLLRSSINYYIGLAETAIMLVSQLELDKNYLNISHKRIKIKKNIDCLYNPLYFVLDNKVRDLSEYYKEKFFRDSINMEIIKKQIIDYKMSSFDAILFFSRLLFPSYYFDCYQSIVLGEKEEGTINIYLSLTNEYQRFLKEIYFFLNQYYEIPEIDWIIKT